MVHQKIVQWSRLSSTQSKAFINPKVGLMYEVPKFVLLNLYPIAWDFLSNLYMKSYPETS